MANLLWTPEMFVENLIVVPLLNSFKEKKIHGYAARASSSRSPCLFICQMGNWPSSELFSFQGLLAPSCMNIWWIAVPAWLKARFCQQSRLPCLSPFRSSLGAYIYDVHNLFGLFDPLPSLSSKSILFVRKFGIFLDPLTPSIRTSDIEAPFSLSPPFQSVQWSRRNGLWFLLSFCSCSAALCFQPSGSSSVIRGPWRGHVLGDYSELNSRNGIIL